MTDTPQPTDAFGDLANLRLSQDFTADIGVKRVITTVPCRKPKRQEFFRVRPGEDWRLQAAAIEDEESRETYLVFGADLQAEIAEETRPVCLFTCINRRGGVFLWPAKLPSEEGRANAWHESALKAAELAETKWGRMQASMADGLYQVFQAEANLPEPEWPELSFPALLKLSFKNRLIDDADHTILQQLRGER